MGNGRLLAALRTLGIAAVAVGAGALVRAVALGSLGTRAPWITFYPAVMLAALGSGLAGGLLATALSCGVVAFGWRLLAGEPILVAGPDWLGLGVFALVGAMIAAVGEGRRRTRGREQALGEERRILLQRLRAYFDSPMVAIAVTSPTKGWLEANPAFCKLLGYSREELAGKTWADLTHPEDVAADVASFQRVLAGEADGYSMDKRCVRKDGSAVWASMAVSCVRRPDGSVQYLVALLTDASARKSAEEDLRRSEAVLQGILDTSPAGFALLRGRELRYELVSPAYQAIGPGRALLGRTYAECWPEIADQVVPVSLRVLETGESFQAVNLRYAIDRGGMEREDAYFSFFLQRIPGSDGNEPALLVTALETTRVVKADAERAALERRLHLASRLASLGTLAAGMAHEVNNPLTALTAGLGSLSEETRDGLERLQRGVMPSREELLLERVESLRVLEEGEAGAARIAQIVRDLAIFGGVTETRVRCRLLDVATTAMRWVAPWVGGMADVRIEGPQRPEVHVSRGQIEQVVVNLVQNAARATPPDRRGEVTVRVGPGSPGMVRLDVLDRGIGIAPGILGKIFDPFFTTRPAGEGRGTGLGLAICHAIVTAHDGTIQVESEPGRGSIFRVELPMAPATDGPDAPDAG